MSVQQHLALGVLISLKAAPSSLVFTQWHGCWELSLCLFEQLLFVGLKESGILPWRLSLPL